MSSNRSHDTLATIGVVLGAGLVIGGLVCLGGYLSRCKKCDKWFSERTVNKVVVK